MISPASPLTRTAAGVKKGRAGWLTVPVSWKRAGKPKPAIPVMPVGSVLNARGFFGWLPSRLPPPTFFEPS